LICVTQQGKLEVEGQKGKTVYEKKIITENRKRKK